MSKADTSADTTHFGYKTVPSEEKAGLVRGVFDSVASRYDIMNDLMSGGLHRLWKRHTVDQAAVRPGHSVLDLAGGTGDLALKIRRQVGAAVMSCSPTSTPPCSSRVAKGSSMPASQAIYPSPRSTLKICRSRQHLRSHYDGLRACATSRTRMPRCVDASRAEAWRQSIDPRVLAARQALKPAYDLYSFKVLPVDRQARRQDEDSYQYLAESIRMHPDQETLLGMMQGRRVRALPLSEPGRWHCCPAHRVPHLGAPMNPLEALRPVRRYSQSQYSRNNTGARAVPKARRHDRRRSRTRYGAGHVFRISATRSSPSRTTTILSRTLYHGFLVTLARMAGGRRGRASRRLTGANRRASDCAGISGAARYAKPDIEEELSTLIGDVGRTSAWRNSPGLQQLGA